MHIIYTAPVCPESRYRRLFADTEEKPGLVVQKYHRLFVEGLAVHCRTDVISCTSLGSSSLPGNRLALPQEEEAGAVYHYPVTWRDPIRRRLGVFWGAFSETWKLADKDSVILTDCLCLAASCGAAAAAFLRRRPLVSVVTDLPDMFDGGGALQHIGNAVIRASAGYVVLTEAMAGYIRQKVTGKQKPYVVIEGQSDIHMREKQPDIRKKGTMRVCMYAGNLSAQYGLRELVEGFRKAGLPGTQLHLYGAGDYVEEIQRISQEDPSVFYGGVLFSDQIVEKEQQATLLVNPRPTGEEYTKYSFPSKTMEYMSTGTPVLTTHLPGLPDAYLPHLYLIREESADGIAQALREALEHTDAELFAFGSQAREFVLEERNNIRQSARLVSMIRTQLLGEGGTE